jgi:hypothetical protein
MMRVLLPPGFIAGVSPGKEALYSILENIARFSRECIFRHEMTIVFAILNIENFNSES